jgi:predicted amidohydrolase
MQLAIYQGAGTLLDVAQNLELLAQTAAEAAQGGAEFLILPELFLTGYNIGDQIATVAESWQGRSLQLAAEIAREHHIAMLFGYIEAADGVFYNSAALIDADGQMLGNYRKIHLFGAEEQRLFTPGDRWLIQTIAGMKVGVLICYDIEFPEAVRSLALQGAELIAVPTAISPPYEFVPQFLVPSRAIENQVFVAYVNRVGVEGNLKYFGSSQVIAPNGEILIQADSEASLQWVKLDQIAIATARSSEFCYVKERRPDLYQV